MLFVDLFLSMAKKLFSFLTFLFLLHFPGKAQYWDWAKQSTGGGGIGTQSAVDKNGNVYIIIEQFCCSVGYGTQTFTSETVFAKHDAFGNVQWAYPLNGIRGFAISTDTMNNVYVSGEYWNGAVFNSAANTQTLSSKGGYDAFLAKCTGNGNLVWIRTFGDTISNDNYTTLKTDAGGNSYLSGYEDYACPTPAMHEAIRYFVSKYDSNGNLIWNIIPPWENPAMPFASDLDINGNYYITGNIKNNVSFGSTTLVVSPYLYTIFIAKFDKNGNIVWAKTDGTNYDEVKGISADNKGYFYLNGFHANPSTFGTTTLNGPAPGGMFIVKYDAAGNVIWAKREGVKYGRGIACDSSGFFIAGVFTPPYSSPPPSTGTLGVGSNSVSLYSPKGEFFIAKYDENGNLKWGIQPSGNTGQADWSNHICSDKKGNCFVTGNFEGTTICGSNTLYSPYTSNNYESFLIKVKDSSVITTAIKNISSTQNQITISPNPTGSIFDIVYKNETKGNVTVKICDVSGKCIYTKLHKDVNGDLNDTIDLSDLSRGIYFIEIIGVGYKETKKLVLQ
jgi:hypothetical protein